jgi:hypothetical protein
VKKLLFCCALLLLVIPKAHASNVGVNVGINIGGPAPMYVNPPVVIAAPPVFGRPPQLGFFVAAGVGYDMFFHSNLYYLNSGNGWYASSYYNGPWTTVHYQAVPYVIKKHKIKKIHYYRDNSYRHYKYNRERHHVRHFRPHGRAYVGQKQKNVGRDYDRGHDQRNGRGNGGGHGHGSGK